MDYGRNAFGTKGKGSVLVSALPRVQLDFTPVREARFFPTPGADKG